MWLLLYSQNLWHPLETNVLDRQGLILASEISAKF
jgi:hypothetical protein